MEIPNIHTDKDGTQVSWQSSVQHKDPQVVLVPAAYLLACRRNASGSGACTAVKSNQTVLAPNQSRPRELQK